MVIIGLFPCASLFENPTVTSCRASKLETKHDNQIISSMSVIQLGTFVVAVLSTRSKSFTSTDIISNNVSEEEIIPWYHGINMEESGNYKLNEFDQSVESNTSQNCQKSCSDLTGLYCSVLSEQFKQGGVAFADDTIFLNRDEERRKEFLSRRKHSNQNIWSRLRRRMRRIYNKSLRSDVSSRQVHSA